MDNGVGFKGFLFLGAGLLLFTLLAMGLRGDLVERYLRQGEPRKAEQAGYGSAIFGAVCMSFVGIISVAIPNVLAGPFTAGPKASTVARTLLD